ncbi:RNA methyltransferase [Halobaculum magnesiiphilum]|uniref:RNA methyltransferase n=1 Tax=Halobaculum magnesiiphilum TaxID=1017351 RepID=A0A8T8WCF8_9EURY|nr:RNA methyltransferase [Halobaculum magnesiiphilum]QZP37486.1 RNA methyltransferase [Halobaculum magnesiiphilum]
MNGTTLDVLVPSSLVREAEDGREATRKLGYVARAATVFRADRLVVFPDREGERRRGGEYVRTVLEYCATPAYLRREVWGKREELRHAGVLPPMRPARSGPDGSELREGIVTEVGPEGRVRVNCGTQHPISLHASPGREYVEGERVTVRVSSREPVRARLTDDPAPGFRVTGAALEDALADAELAVATSRHGRELSVSGLADVRARMRDTHVAVAFGSPGRGLPAILGMDTEDVPVDPDATDGSGFDLWLNAIPRQGSEVVRTEEAIFAALSPLTLTE